MTNKKSEIELVEIHEAANMKYPLVLEVNDDAKALFIIGDILEDEDLSDQAKLTLIKAEVDKWLKL